MSKGLVSENRSTKNMVNVAKHYSKLNDSTLPYLLIVANSIQVEKVFLSDIENFTRDC